MRNSAMLALALMVPGVMGCNDAGPPPTLASVPDSADQVGYEIAHWISLDGVRRIKIESDTVYFYQASQTAELLGVRVEFYSMEGVHTSTVRSVEGTYNWRTENMEARGDVVATTPDGRRLTTELLRFDRATEQISGPDAFVFDGPDGHLEGDGFTADPDFTNVLTTNPRRGRMGGSDGT